MYILGFSKEGDMKLTRIVVLFVFFTLAAGTAPVYAHRDFDDRHYSGGEDNVWLCPWCFDSLGSDNWNGGINWFQDYRDRYKLELEKHSPELEEPLTMDQARYLVDNYIYLSGIPDLKPGKIIEKDNEFDAEIVTKDGSFLDMLIIDKHTGLIIDRQTGVVRSSY
jgi:hypothetical protein